MMSRLKKICLISAGLPSSNPRLVKEAEALSEAGYKVHCIVGDYATPLRRCDEDLLGRASVTVSRVGLGTPWGYKARRIRQELARFVARRGISGEWFSTWAASTQCSRLAAAASRIEADLYIGHTLPALPAAVWAARRYAALAGFDAEDLHSAETGNWKLDEPAALVERLFLNECQHLTASSPLIAAEYYRRYGVEMVTLLNVFPRNTSTVPRRRLHRQEERFSLYWFSQTVGPGRGLEQVIRAAARVSIPIRICLRGIISESYRRDLESLAYRSGGRLPLEFLEPAHPAEMISLAAHHDLGLSLELIDPPNRSLSLTNKFFTYLQAGIPQLVSRTPAQTWAADECGDAAILVDLDDSDSVAVAIDMLATDLERYERAAATAVMLAQARFCWEVEREKFVDAVGRCLDRAPLVAADRLGSYGTAEAIQ